MSRIRSSIVLLSPPTIGEEEIQEVVAALRSGWLTTGPRVEQFEAAFASHVGSPAALAVSSCTAAMHLALLALKIGPGDAVITTPMTFCSSVQVIEHVGAVPILADVEADTLNISGAEVERAIIRAKAGGYRVRALLPVHLYGHPCELDELIEIGQKHNLAIVEDAAHSLGARYKGQLIGGMATQDGVPLLSCFSFYATKNLTTGEGGMLAGMPALVNEARILAMHGLSGDSWDRLATEDAWSYDIIRPGFKYNMSDINAAIGLAQLQKLAAFEIRRREIAERYDQAFAAMAEIEVPPCRAGIEHAWHLYVIKLRKAAFAASGVPVAQLRNRLIQELRRRCVEASVHFIPVHLHTYYRHKFGYQPDDFPVAWAESNRVLSLPIHPGLSDEDVEDVIDAVKEAVQGLH
jgi:dTDP-4-amino-4,6-dideoxygalactose transaminase